MVKIGKVIKAFRKRKKFTLKELAEKAKISSSYLSQIENDQVNMNMSVLESICQALEIPIYMCFMQERIKDIHVVRNDDRKKIYREDHVIEEYLTNDRFFNLEIHILTLPQEHYPEDYAVHQGEEFIFVLEGEIDIDFSGFQTFHLQSGDSIAYSSAIPHSIKCDTCGKVLVASSTSPITVA